MKYPQNYVFSIKEVLERWNGDRVIGVDMDDVFFPLIPGLIKWLRRERGMKLRLRDFKSYRLKEVLGTNLARAVDLVERYIKSDYHWQIEPIEGAIDVLREAKREGFRFHVITSRNKSKYGESTERYIETHANRIFEGVHFTHNHYTRHNGSGSKSEICKKIGARAMIEDTVENAAELNRNGIRVIMPPWPWNRGYENHLVIRVRGWI